MQLNWMLFRYRTVAASSLMIKDVTEEDNGSYQCRAKNDIDTLDAVAEVIVQGTLRLALNFAKWNSARRMTRLKSPARRGNGLSPRRGTMTLSGAKGPCPGDTAPASGFPARSLYARSAPLKLIEG